MSIVPVLAGQSRKLGHIGAGIVQSSPKGGNILGRSQVFWGQGLNDGGKHRILVFLECSFKVTKKA